MDLAYLVGLSGVKQYAFGKGGLPCVYVCYDSYVAYKFYAVFACHIPLYVVDKT